ncbi:MAG: alpha-1,3-galactosidase B [Bacteroidaceae bacterium]|nr:alpha-1,3-galactosidase B [Bacteroidaceae bacterium]
MKRIILNLCLLGLLVSACNGPQVVEMSAYQIVPDTKENLSGKMQEALNTIQATYGTENIVLKFEKGRYDFYPEGAAQKEYYISNHDQPNPKSVGLALEGWKQLTVDGAGADFIFHGRMLPVSLIESENCTLKNFSIDFEKPHIAQVEIVESTPEGMIFRPEPWVNARVGENGHFENYGEGWRNYPQAGIAFDRETRHVVYKTSDLWCPTNETKQLDDSTFQAPYWKDSRLVPGTKVAMRTWERPAPGIFLFMDKDTRLENVNVHYAEGMGLLAQICENITLEKFNVCLRGENDPRYFTTQADATHFSGCKGKITSCNGLYEGMMDDAINVHGTYLKIVQKVDDKTVIGRYMHPQAYGFYWGGQGDKVQFVRSSTMELLDEPNEIAAIEAHDKETAHGAKEYKITFVNPIDTVIRPEEGFGIENLEWCPEVYFADNVIRNNRARGTLFSTPLKTVVERNTFDHTSGTAILLCGDCNGWFETGACRDVTIRENKFINSLTNLFQFTEAVISIYPEIPNLKDQQKYFHGGEGQPGVLIENNEFVTFDRPIVFAKSIDGLTFRGNKIIQNEDFPAFHNNQTRFRLLRAKNVVIENNDFSDGDASVSEE